MADALPATLWRAREHPFWDATHRRLTDAHDLTPGTKLHTANGTTATITGIRSFHRHGITYDLTVGTFHTYYVGAGETPVLVHNCGGAEDATEIVSKKADEYHDSQEAARSAAL
ncbi:HINT domain-containing protein [Streptomyces sp. NBC_00340]|uniref:polymorphic toxin-type HINT domain-containing protein n=1 Tax=unclassified Streptomyces TaxID=2593676 RepID=UPI0022533120|nr:polymorphic toxin-type HINT domain-containing protein [Streptomyces sp. NBC_00340]MCX5136443.1 HINT domain-containing protein [Streptomyces sp. NBC_00340]